MITAKKSYDNVLCGQGQRADPPLIILSGQGRGGAEVKEGVATGAVTVWQGDVS